MADTVTYLPNEGQRNAPDQQENRIRKKSNKPESPGRYPMIDKDTTDNHRQRPGGKPGEKCPFRHSNRVYLQASAICAEDRSNDKPASQKR